MVGLGFNKIHLMANPNTIENKSLWITRQESHRKRLVSLHTAAINALDSIEQDSKRQANMGQVEPNG